MVVTVVIAIIIWHCMKHLEGFEETVAGANLYDLFGYYSNSIINYISCPSTTAISHLINSVKQISGTLGSDIGDFEDFNRQLSLIIKFIENPTDKNIEILSNNSYDIAFKLYNINPNYEINKGYLLLQRYIDSIIRYNRLIIKDSHMAKCIRVNMHKFAHFILVGNTS